MNAYQVWHLVSPNNPYQAAQPQWRLAQSFSNQAAAQNYVAAQASRPWPFNQRSYQVLPA